MSSSRCAPEGEARKPSRGCGSGGRALVSFPCVTIWGGWGVREDHTLGCEAALMKERRAHGVDVMQMVRCLMRKVLHKINHTKKDMQQMTAIVYIQTVQTVPFHKQDDTFF
eukprot:1161763-Pelagomonas_calceolata.AAC.5